MRHRIMLAFIIVGALVWSFRTPATPRPLFTMKDSGLRGEVRVGTAFDRTASGSLTGLVEWHGAVPEVDPFYPRRCFYTPDKLPRMPNPNAPEVNAHRLQSAVVHLRQVNPTLARPWDHEPVRVEWRDYQVHIRQGEQQHRVGFVKQGDVATFVSHEPVLHSVHGHGATFFTYPLSRPNVPVERPMVDRGLIELSSGSVYVWARAYLFVCEHPYYTLTDDQGRFALTDIPAGDYELVYWHPNWHIAQRELDPELLVDCRVTFQAPVAHVVPVRVRAGEATAVPTLAFDAGQFVPSK
jgi:hypothetical protein